MVTYDSYLQVDDLLKLQRPLSKGPEHDETLFIIVHQVYELWFKQMLHELHFLQKNLEANDRAQVLKTFKRFLTILKLAVQQVDIVETMTPTSFSSFRATLETASGFQSLQFRELEFLLGHRSEERLKKMPPTMRQRLEPYLSKRSLFDSFLIYLHKNGHPIPTKIFERNLANAVTEDEELQQVLIRIYQNDPLATEICERMVDVDEGIQEWRYRHVKMAERTIGIKMGTGGSSGTSYLRQTLFQPMFPDLWSIRASL